MKYSAPKTVLCLHDLSGMGRCSLTACMPVLAAMGHQPVPVATALFSTHTGGLGQPARLSAGSFGMAALQHYRSLGIDFDCIYAGYLATQEDQLLAAAAFDMWPNALKILDPVMADNGHFYTGMQDKLPGLKQLCQKASLILPNLTEACLLLDKPFFENQLNKETALDLAAQLTALCPQAVITGLPMDKHLGCAGGGRESFLVQRLQIDRSYPGTGDLFASVLCGALLRGNALSAAVDAAAGFVGDAINATDPAAPTALGVWFEPLLNRLCERSF